MKRMISAGLFFAALTAGCCSQDPAPVEPADASADKDVQVIPPYEFCAPPPYAQLPGAGFERFSDAACLLDRVYLEMASDPVGGLQLRCAQFTTGEVFCMDATGAVDVPYKLSPAGCVKEVGAGPWFVWRSCGFAPTP